MMSIISTEKAIKKKLLEKSKVAYVITEDESLVDYTAVDTTYICYFVPISIGAISYNYISKSGCTNI